MKILSLVLMLSATGSALAGDATDVAGFVKSTLAGTLTLSRWKNGICPSTSGFADKKSNEQVSGRIREIADLVAAPKGNSACATNIHVYFTSDPQALIASIRDHGGPNLFPVTHPIQAWYFTLDRDAHSGAIGSNVTVAEYGSARLVSELAQVFVIVDANQTKTYQLATVADYIAVLALAEMKIAGACQKLQSVTNLIFTDCDAAFKANAITVADTAYLKAIYNVKPSDPFRLQRADIVSEMKKALGAQ